MTQEDALLAIAYADGWAVEQGGGQTLAEWMRQTALKALGADFAPTRREVAAMAIHEAFSPYADYTYPWHHPLASHEMCFTLADAALSVADSYTFSPDDELRAAKALIDLDPCISGHHETHIALMLPKVRTVIAALCDSGRLPKGEDSRSEAECEASQSGAEGNRPNTAGQPT